MILPYIDPVAIYIGPIAIRWYGLSWLAAFGLIYFLANLRLKIISKDQISDLMFYSLLGAIIGGRAGYMIFYNIDQLLNNPLSIFFIWQGGLSFHGGLLGVLISVAILVRFWNKNFLDIMDVMAPCVPVGLGCVRIGNFLNSELLGRPTDLSWGVIFPSDPLGLLRHPSQIYQALFEGIILFIFILWFARTKRPKGYISAAFLIGYGVIRCFTEIFREPDSHIGFDLFGFLTRGQLLSIPMIVAGIMLLFYSYHKSKKKNGTVS